MALDEDRVGVNAASLIDFYIMDISDSVKVTGKSYDMNHILFYKFQIGTIYFTDKK